ncbi:hypothetical protein QBC43DRAFT_291645 [Cladorrhinum sp. PSN259]|nr:hypothetical protein QBC43DRAFT_291645 [Cladorrhinum sp. PSN259]
MKLSIFSVLITAMSGFAVASPAANQDLAIREPGTEYQAGRAQAGYTPVDGPILSKRSPIGTMKTWTTNPTSGCTGTPGQTITNPVSGACYTHGSGTPQVFVRALWEGNVCDVYFYTNSNCNPAGLSATGTVSLVCWNYNWTFKSFKLIC